MKFQRKNSAEKWKWKFNIFVRHLQKLRFRANRGSKNQKKKTETLGFGKTGFFGIGKISKLQ